MTTLAELAAPEHTAIVTPMVKSNSTTIRSGTHKVVGKVGAKP